MMLELLQFHRIEVNPVSSSQPQGQQQGECPFCEKSKFFVNPEKQLWDCKTCGKEGNQFTLLTELHRKALNDTTDKNYEDLVSQRKGLTTDALAGAQFAWDSVHSRWLVPYQNGSEFLNNLGSFIPNRGFRIYKSPGLPLKLYRPFDTKDFQQTIVVTEGEWDLLAIQPHLPSGCSVVGIPGAMSFKQEYLNYFKNKDVILLYDKDDAGKAGIAKAIRLLNPVANSLKFLAWPEDYEFPSADDPNKEGKDLRDLVAHNQ